MRRAHFGAMSGATSRAIRRNSSTPRVRAELRYAETFHDESGGAAAVDAAALAQEAMDDDEKFEALQTENVMASNPESLAYFRANKAMMRKRGGKPLRA